MKNKITKLLKFGLTFFVIGLLLTNCEKENTQEETSQIEKQEQTLTLKYYSRENIEKKSKLVSKLKKFNDKVIENKSARQSGKNVYNKEFDFTIYTDAATYIEDGDYHSYTFPLVQDDDDKIANLLFELNEENEYDAFLVNYDYSANDLKYKDFESLSMKTSIKPIDLDFNSLFARTQTAYVCVYSYEYVKTGTRFTNGDSNLIEDVYSWVLTASYCETVLYYDEDYKEYQQGNTATVTIGGTIYGGTGGSKTSPMPSPFNAEELAKIDVVKNRLNLNRLEKLWIDEWVNGQYAFKLHDFGATNKWSEEAIDFAYQAFVVFMNSNTTEKELVSALLTNDTETIAEVLVGNNQIIECCEYNPECCDEIFDPMVQLTARIVIDARDGIANLISAWVQHNLIIPQNRKGKFVRNVMEQMGVEVPTDVDNETLAELFKVRQRNLELVVEPVEDYLNELLDIGISIIDVLAIVSPSKGAGAFIFAKTGTGTITAKALSDHLKTIANIASTTLSGGKGYKSFSAFKKVHGNASSGNALHHIVEQNGFQSLNQLKFGRTNIHNTKNIINIPNGTGSLHDDVTRYYSQIHSFTEGKRFREWIADLSFQEQYDWGIKVLKDHGWDGVTGLIN